MLFLFASTPATTGLDSLLPHLQAIICTWFAFPFRLFWGDIFLKLPFSYYTSSVPAAETEVNRQRLLDSWQTPQSLLLPVHHHRVSEATDNGGREGEEAEAEAEAQADSPIKMAQRRRHISPSSLRSQAELLAEDSVASLLSLALLLRSVRKRQHSYLPQ